MSNKKEFDLDLNFPDSSFFPKNYEEKSLKDMFVLCEKRLIYWNKKRLESKEEVKIMTKSFILD